MTQLSSQRGALLIEILLAVSAFAILAAIGAQAMYVSLLGNQSASKKESGAELLTEMMQGVRGASETDWQNLYGLTKDTVHYHPALSGNAWTIVAGDEAITLGGVSFTRYFTVSNVSRDSSTRDIQSTYASANDDPATQSVSAFVTSTTTAALSLNEYFFRWRNKVCNQTSWTTAGSGSTVRTCPDTNYDSKSAGINTAGGSLQLQ